MEMDGRNEQTDTLVDIEEQATQHVVAAMKGKLQSVSGSAPAWTSVPLEYDLESEPMNGAAPAWTSVPLGAAPMIGGAPMVTMKEKLGSLSDASEDLSTSHPNYLNTSSTYLKLPSNIYRVPKHLRDTNEAAYVPRLVSLGPFHHGNVNLKAMEEHKLRCFERFIDELELDRDALRMLVKEREEITRGFYADGFELPGDQFVQVILVDAIFVINFLLQSNSSALAIQVRSIYHKKFFWSVVSRDMMLLENQLPLSILKEILHFAASTTGTGKSEKRSVTELSNFLFNCHMKEGGSVTNPSNCCLFNCHMKERRTTDHESDMTDLNSKHFVDLQRLLFKPVEARTKAKNYGKFKKIKSISKLHEAGVRFRVASGKNLFHMEFKDGVLEIPGIVVADPTETIFRNLVAYDQCHYGPSPVGDYFVLMGMLIDTADDVDLLVKNKILQNDLPTAQEVSKVFNSLEKEVFYDAESFYYSHLCEQLNKFCDIPWHKWMATLKQNYLDTPWKVISLIAAFILLVLTMIQTVCSVISL